MGLRPNHWWDPLSDEAAYVAIQGFQEGVCLPHLPVQAQTFGHERHHFQMDQECGHFWEGDASFPHVRWHPLIPGCRGEAWKHCHHRGNYCFAGQVILRNDVFQSFITFILSSSAWDMTREMPFALLSLISRRSGRSRSKNNYSLIRNLSIWIAGTHTLRDVWCHCFWNIWLFQFLMQIKHFHGASASLNMAYHQIYIQFYTFTAVWAQPGKSQVQASEG